MPAKSFLIRDAEAGNSLELLFVASIATILGIRGFLALTGYPQIGGGPLHIAHMLWGGLFMLVAIGLLLVFWSPAARRGAAFLAGVGFGAFIDELGKFITADNDYFFQPTIALLYVLFVLVFLVVRALQGVRLAPYEVELNAIVQERAGAGAIARMGLVGERYLALRAGIDSAYNTLVDQPWFNPLLSAAFVFRAVSHVVTGALFLFGHGGDEHDVSRLYQLASAVSAACVVIGAWRLRTSRLAAYRWFMRSVLLSIFVIQVFLFYRSQLAAIGGLIVEIAAYLALRYSIEREEASQ